jgi:pimeloyl-ACP methyl ester carboxylesterase
MAPLAAAAAEQGAVVFNVSYGATTPAEVVNDIGCSLQLAAESAADFGGDPERMVVVGHSFGGASALAWGLDSPLRGEQFTDCVADADSVQELPDAVVAVASGTNPRNLPAEAWQQADDAVLDAATPILLVGGNPDLQAFFATQEGIAGVFAIPEDSIAIHEALLASGYESTLVELAGAHGTAVNDSSPEFPRLVELVLAAVDTVR